MLVELEPAYRGKSQPAAGYKIGLGPHGSESWPAFKLKSPGLEPIEFKPPTPNPFKPEASNPKPRKPKAPKFKAKPNKLGTKDNSSPPKEFSRWKEVPPKSNWCA